MARLQTVWPPERDSGAGVPVRPFGLVFDEVDPPLSDEERADFNNFGASLGAAGVLVTSRTVDCDPGAEIDWPEDFAQEMREMVDGRLREHVQALAAQQQAQQKPPPDTVEGKVARTWGGSGQDPRDVIRAKVGQVSGRE